MTLHLGAILPNYGPALVVPQRNPLVALKQLTSLDFLSGGRVVLRTGVYFDREPDARGDERGRHAITGPADWVAERLREYADVGVDGFVLNLDHQKPGLDERLARFAEEIMPLIRR